MIFVPEDKYTEDNRGMSEKELEGLKKLHLRSYRKRLSYLAKQYDFESREDSDQCVDTAMESAVFIHGQTHPLKISAQLQGNTTVTQPELTALRDAITDYSTESFERQLVTTGHELASELALQAYICYNTRAICQSGSTKGNAWQVLRGHIEETRELLQNKRVSYSYSNDFTLLSSAGTC
jgi:hypothetical protein